MPNFNLREAKTKLRQEILTARGKIEEKAEKDRRICEKILNANSYKTARSVLLYHPLEKEINILPVIEDALASGKTVALPRCGGTREMRFYIISSLADLESGKFNLSEPKEECEEAKTEDFDFCLLPGLAFDKYGYRLGYGKGYYDNNMSEFSGIKMGAVYAEFLYETLPRGKFDFPANIIVTEKMIFPAKLAKGW